MKKIYETDPWLEPWKEAVNKRHSDIETTASHLCAGSPDLKSAVNNHLYYGLHRQEDGSWVFREWAPNASRIYLVGDFNNWRRLDSYALTPIGGGNWEIRIPSFCMHHGDLYKLFIEWPGGGGERIPAYAIRTVQDPQTKVFSAQVWDPEVKYVWRHRRPSKRRNPFIYECHIGMSSEEEKVASFDDFRRDVLPKVASLGYDVIQIMALQEHPYYGSFGYQVSNFFALSSRFGTPEEFKALVDEAHGMGIAVIMDIVHSHSVNNEAEGLSFFDGREDLYFFEGSQGHHPAWGSRCFNYGKDETRLFLLSNCKFWLEEYKLDGFRFDGVTSMLYWNHGLGQDFGDYSEYFGPGVDNDAVIYLALANRLVKEVCKSAITIAEDVSGMPGLAAPFECGGIGFDFRMAMGVADHWIKWIKEIPDEQWPMGSIWWELTNKRLEERTISYAECHDQALVGDQTIIFRLIGSEMYWSMNKGSQSVVVDRGVALHKLIRLVTAATAGDGYLNFMGNEFGHPEWIDFPREGNGWSYKYARRQWSLPENSDLRYGCLRNFDAVMVDYIRSRGLLASKPELITVDEQKKVLIFMRKSSIFVFNFHQDQSFSDYEFAAPGGVFVTVFDTDEARFDGFSRLEKKSEHFSMDRRCPNGNRKFDHTLSLYLPSRSAIVLELK